MRLWEVRASQIPPRHREGPYGAGLLDWLKDTMLADGRIGPDELALIRIADDPDEVIKIIKEARPGLLLT